MAMQHSIAHVLTVCTSLTVNSGKLYVCCLRQASKDVQLVEGYTVAKITGVELSGTCMCCHLLCAIMFCSRMGVCLGYHPVCTTIVCWLTMVVKGERVGEPLHIVWRN